MPRFLIEIPHSDRHDYCVRALDAILKLGSHFVTQADFGCDDGVHTGWLVVDVEDREEAQRLVPPEFRADARVVRLRRWTREEIEALKKDLEKEAAGGA
jgi:hypothetical protein